MWITWVWFHLRIIFWIWHCAKLRATKQWTLLKSSATKCPQLVRPIEPQSKGPNRSSWPWGLSPIPGPLPVPTEVGDNFRAHSNLVLLASSCFQMKAFSPPLVVFSSLHPDDQFFLLLLELDTVYFPGRDKQTFLFHRLPARGIDLKRNQSFATAKLLSGLLIFKLLIKKWDSERTFGFPPHSCPRDSDTKTSFRRGPWLNHPKKLLPSFGQEDSRPVSEIPPCPIVSEVAS